MLASHYARGLMRACGAHAIYIHTKATAESGIVSELLPGEGFAVLEYAGGWAWGYCEADGIVGYVEAIALATREETTHIVCEKWAPVAPDARVNAPILAGLPIGSRLHGQESGGCLATEYGCVPLSHLRPIADHDEDPVVVAERMMSVPWLDGGRGPGGIDASGLIQLALGLCGIAAPRLADQQAELGEFVAAGLPLRHGDLVFAGEVAGLMVDDLMFIHASAAAGKVTTAPYATIAGPETMRRRLAF